VLFIFGEFNVFTKADASLILSKARKSLKDDGVLILEVNPYGSFKQPSASRSGPRQIPVSSPTSHMLI